MCDIGNLFEALRVDGLVQRCKLRIQTVYELCNQRFKAWIVVHCGDHSIWQ